MPRVFQRLIDSGATPKARAKSARVIWASNKRASNCCLQACIIDKKSI
nr:MAG TPA: hypothetical protein [Caudoviricetes sp.]